MKKYKIVCIQGDFSEDVGAEEIKQSILFALSDDVQPNGEVDWEGISDLGRIGRREKVKFDKLPWLTREE